MQQLELFEYRRDCLFDSKNQIGHYFDILKETKDTISYAEHIEPNSGFAIAGMSYEEYVDINKDKLNTNESDFSRSSHCCHGGKKRRWWRRSIYFHQGNYHQNNYH